MPEVRGRMDGSVTRGTAAGAVVAPAMGVTVTGWVTMTGDL
jgi:hypothetical protein